MAISNTTRGNFRRQGNHFDLSEIPLERCHVPRIDINDLHVCHQNVARFPLGCINDSSVIVALRQFFQQGIQVFGGIIIDGDCATTAFVMLE